jgi:beta-1,4-mannooligosaccharide/beta-1,4-mannosyl-N-acetylglucosamine phosphorylase
VGGETVLLARVKDLRGISHLTTCRSKNGLCAWQVDPEPTFAADPDNHPEEAWGVEDPRATWIPEMGLWGVVYAAYSRQGHQICMATTTDFRTFERRGTIIPPEDKNAALFPRRFKGKWAILHRPVVSQEDASIWISYSEDLVHWGDSNVVMECRRGPWWDAQRVGTGPPPMETKHGWLLLYYGARRTTTSSIYHAGLALLDLEDPRRLLHRSEEWILGPREMCEMLGEEPNVVLPTGWVMDGDDTIRLYYGAADTCIAVATASLSEVLDYVLSCPKVG